MRQLFAVALASFITLAAAPTVAGESAQESESPSDQDKETSVEASITGELGFLDVLSHRIQYGRNGSEIDYVEEGGQEILFNFTRISADIEFGGRHHVVLLYQPLDIRSQVRLDRDLRISGTTFPRGTSVDMRYSFPFYRASYLYDLMPSDEKEIGIGASLQLRNATISFTSVDGSYRQVNRDLGPVPVLKYRMHWPLPGEYWFEFEADGSYAPVSYLNGDDNDVVGAILDASLRAGRPLTPRIDGFINLRYLGGGSEGVNDDEEPPGAYTRNWLHFATISLGFTWSTSPK